MVSREFTLSSAETAFLESGPFLWDFDGNFLAAPCGGLLEARRKGEELNTRAPKGVAESAIGTMYGVGIVNKVKSKRKCVSQRTSGFRGKE